MTTWLPRRAWAPAAIGLLGLVAGCTSLSRQGAPGCGVPGACPTPRGATCAQPGAPCGDQACDRTCADSATGRGAGGVFGHLPQCVRKIDWEQVHPDNCWPEQYNYESRRRVYEPFRQQLIAGQRIEQTIWTHLFLTEEEEEHELSPAGLARLRYLARKKPYVIPNLELQTSFDEELDAKRVQSIIAAANDFSFEPVAWQVTLVNREPTGLFGPEGPQAIRKMIGPQEGETITPPYYETFTKPSFFGDS